MGKFNVFFNKPSFSGYYCNLEAYPFHLQNTKSKEVELSDFLGNYCYLFFGYTLCSKSCPQSLSTLFRLSEMIDIENVTFIFISIDHERDNQDRLAAFQKNLGPQFVVLHGLPKEVRHTARKYFTYYQKTRNRFKDPNPTQSINHTDNIYFIDKKGTIKLIYQKPFQNPVQMAEDLKYFMRR